jgi:ribosomal protein L29
MAKSLNMKEIRGWGKPETQKHLTERLAELRNLRVRAAVHDLKNVRAIRTIRLEIARLVSRIKEISSQVN